MFNFIQTLWGKLVLYIYTMYNFSKEKNIKEESLPLSQEEQEKMREQRMDSLKRRGLLNNDGTYKQLRNTLVKSRIIPEILRDKEIQKAIRSGWN